MDTVVLIAIICPNFANGWMVAWVSGIDAIIVVIALLIMLTPILLTAALERHCRRSLFTYKDYKFRQFSKSRHRRSFYIYTLNTFGECLNVEIILYLKKIFEIMNRTTGV